MRTRTRLVSLSFIAMLAACGSSGNGHYDAGGMWVPDTNATTEAQRIHAPDSTAIHDDYDSHTKVVTYDRAGYYDSNGYYVAADERMGVPPDMLPPRGMCRVWLPNRTPETQPRIESCDGIRSRVPVGGYVIYGG